jgi:putative peptidoglycan lipid II flippase
VQDKPEMRGSEPATPHLELGTRDSGLNPRNSALSTDVAYILRVMPLRMLGSGAVYVNNIVRDNLATRAGAGAVSALNSAFATMILPQAVIAQAISTALFPTISAHAARGDRRAFARTLTQAINVIIALSLPAAAGLVVLGEPIIALLFQRGQFDALASQQAGLALAMYGVGLVGHCVLEIVTRAFYALKDNRPPVLFGVASVALNIALSFVLLPLFATVTPAYFAALALANAIATTLETVALFVVLMRRYPEISLRGTTREFAKSALGASAMSAAVLAWLGAMGGGPLSTLGALLVGGVVYLAAAVALKSALLGLLRRGR